MEGGLGLPVHGLDPGREVDVGHRRDVRAGTVDPRQDVREVALPVSRAVRLCPRAAAPPHLGHQQHVGRGPVELEVLAEPVPPERRGERTEALPELDLPVHRRLHLAASAASPRIERLPRARGPNSIRPWKQPHHASSGDAPGDGRGPRVLGRLLVGDALRLQVLPDARRRTPGPGRPRAWRRPARTSRCRSPFVPVVHRAAPQRPAGVPGRRLDPEVVEDPRAQQLAVGHAVERHPAGQAEVALAGAAPGRGRPARSTISSVTSWIERARSISRRLMAPPGCRAGRRRARRSARWSWPGRSR